MKIKWFIVFASTRSLKVPGNDAVLVITLLFSKTIWTVIDHHFRSMPILVEPRMDTIRLIGKHRAILL